MSQVQIMSVIGSAVPAPLRALGLLACWYLVQDGEADQRPAHFAARRPGLVATSSAKAELSA